MKRLWSAADANEVDRESEARGVSVEILMDNAGAAVAREASRRASPSAEFVVACGPGNNGGDGAVAARRLKERGRKVTVVLGAPAEKFSPLGASRLADARRAGVEISDHWPEKVSPVAVVIDALFGTGLKRAPAGPAESCVRAVNAARAAGHLVVAVDVPSGLDADTGQSPGACVQADVTVTFGAPKVGLALSPGRERAGQVLVADIGFAPAALTELTGAGAWSVERADVLELLPRRRAEDHKGTFGHVLIIAGRRESPGAAALAGMAALRSGAGLVTIAAPRDVLAVVLAASPALMGLELPGTAGFTREDAAVIAARGGFADAVVIGPALGTTAESVSAFENLLKAVSVPMVVDAEALRWLAEKPSLLGASRSPLVLTPHPGEFAHLTRTSSDAVQRDRLAAARGLALPEHSVLILKGAGTIVLDDRKAAYINPTGNPGMATAGSGDVLSGMVGAFLGQGLFPLHASMVATFAHGLAGDLAIARTGQLGLTAVDLVDGLGAVWSSWNR